MSQPGVAIILLNFRGAADTVACVESLKQLAYPAFQIVVVDNASGDGSVETISQAHPDVSLIPSDANLGFSGGNNLGIRHALANPDIAYIWLLNNDTTVDPQALSALVAMAAQHPRDVIGSLVLYPDGRYQRVGNRLDPVRGHLIAYEQSALRDGQVVESLTGCSMLVPREVFASAGLLDERFFLYFEDNEFCLRIGKTGHACRVALQSRVFHKEGATTGRNRPLVTYYYQRNRLILARQYIHPLLFKWIELYTRYRLRRSGIKARLKGDTEAGRHHHAFQLAIADFYQGITGPCPHPL